ncbi:hypothetical protein MIMGU_mgv1a0266252mg, partial [Erythranthe guttata]
WRLQLLNLSAF